MAASSSSGRDTMLSHRHPHPPLSRRHSASQESSDSGSSGSSGSSSGASSVVNAAPPTHSRLPPDGTEFPPDYRDPSSAAGQVIKEKYLSFGGVQSLPSRVLLPPGISTPCVVSSIGSN